MTIPLISSVIGGVELLFDEPLSVPRTAILDITPEMAAKLLERNENNRNQRKPNIEAWAHDMRSGNWKLNGETIKLAYDGRFLDGQNRMQSVVLAGVPAPFLLVYGLPHDAQDTVDVGAKRTLSDVLKLKGYAEHLTLAAIVRNTLLWSVGERRSLGHGKLAPSVPEQLRHLANHPELVEVNKQAVWTRRHFRALQPSLVGLTYWLFDEIDTVDRKEFFMRLIEGANMEKHDPVLMLRNALLHRSTYSATRVLPEMKLAMTIKAWNAFREGRQVENLYWRAGGKSPEKFPEPR